MNVNNNPTSESRKQELISVLRNRGLHGLADRVSNGEFSDFASPHPAPMMELVKLLREHRQNDLAARAREGDFDHDQ